MSDRPPWREVVRPVVEQLRLASLLGHDHVFNPVGAQATAQLLSDMARIIDDEIDRRTK